MLFSRQIYFSCIFLTSIACQGVHSSRILEEELFCVHESETFLNANEGIVYYEDFPFTGRVITEYANATTASSIDYVAGKRHGLYKKWFSDGTLSFQSEYVHGKLHGETRTWWLNGNLRSTSNFDNGIAHGTQEQWYENGAKFKRIQLNFGVEEGIQQTWRENGKLYNNYEAKAGRIFGLKRAQLCYELEEEVIKTIR